MNILVVGNGFDLAHGLPTKYTDFLNFLKVIKQIIKTDFNENIDIIDWRNINTEVRNIIENNIKNHIDSQKVLWSELLNDNIWIGYFLQCNMYQKENWIDFENEISDVIQKIDNDMKKRRQTVESMIKRLPIEYMHRTLINDEAELEQKRDEEAELEIMKLEAEQGEKLKMYEHSDYIYNYKRNHPIENTKESITYKQLIIRLEDDLNRLIKALEIYMVEYIEKIDCKILSPDIEAESFDAVISFNYTDTYTRLYHQNGIPCDYIHGKAINNATALNNMVLGIAEYLPDDTKNIDINFVMFKKFYQRIFKGNGSNYKLWIEEIKENARQINEKLKTLYPVQIPIGKYTEKHHIFIFGHSLDLTDGDILSELILNDNVDTTIYYHKDSDDEYGRKDLAEKITHLLRIIGQDELIRRTGGVTKTIEFRLQQDMQ